MNAFNWRRCSHGRLFPDEPCIECEIVFLEDTVPRMEERARRNRARLDELHAIRGAHPTGEKP